MKKKAMAAEEVGFSIEVPLKERRMAISIMEMLRPAEPQSMGLRRPTRSE